MVVSNPLVGAVNFLVYQLLRGVPFGNVDRGAGMRGTLTFWNLVANILAGEFDYVWYWKKKLPERKGQSCRVLLRGKMNTILVEFADGFKVVTSRYAVRRRL